MSVVLYLGCFVRCALGVSSPKNSRRSVIIYFRVNRAKQILGKMWSSEVFSCCTSLLDSHFCNHVTVPLSTHECSININSFDVGGRKEGARLVRHSVCIGNFVRLKRENTPGRLKKMREMCESVSFLHLPAYIAFESLGTLLLSFCT